jgi:hypothetical protein
MEVRFWLALDGSIHLTANDVKGFHVRINSDGTHQNGHPTLFRRLAACLRDMGAPAPIITDNQDA